MQNGNGTDSFQNKIGFLSSQHGVSEVVAKSGNAFISSLFAPFFLESHRLPLYQRRYYDRAFLWDGQFFGLLPESMGASRLYGVELDPLTGEIAKQLYQRASIAVEGFEKTNLPDDHFDVVIGNVPFGEIRVNDSRYNAQKFLIHDYFFAKALDKVRSGGVVAFITSKGTMDKASPEVRKYIAQRAELLAAVRLPDNTFQANAGTEVTSDILFLQKRDRVADVEPDWIYLDTDENGITMNSYFVQHPEMVLGTMRMESSRFGMDSVCKADSDRPLSELLAEAVQRINGEITEPENGIDEISDE